MKAKNKSAEVHDHISANNKDMITEIILIAIALIALCYVLGQLKDNPLFLEFIK